jgi:5S rRNA maturation endonuclease (ribonuclease M5)
LDKQQAIKELAIKAGLEPGSITKHSSAVKPRKPTFENRNVIDAMTDYEKNLFYESWGKYSEIFPENNAPICALQAVQRERIDSNRVIFTELFEYCRSCGWSEAGKKYILNHRKIYCDYPGSSNLFFIKNYNQISNHLKKIFKDEPDKLSKSGMFNEKGNLIFYSHQIIIPYYNKNQITYLRGRYFFNGSEKVPQDMSKYLGLKNDALGVNTPKRFYNIDIIDKMFPGETLFICEGEFDCIILNQLCVNAIAIPGSGNIPDLNQFKKLEPFKIYLCMDNDSAGSKLLSELKKIFFQLNKTITLKNIPNKDINEFVMEINK